MPRSRRQPVVAPPPSPSSGEDDDEEAEEQEQLTHQKRKKKQKKGAYQYRPQFRNPDAGQEDKRVRIDVALYMFAQRYRNMPVPEPEFAERYVREMCDICATLLPMRFCIVMNHFNNVYRSLKQLKTVTFDQYLYDIAYVNQCHNMQVALMMPANKHLCSPHEYEEDDGTGAHRLLPRRRRHHTKLFTSQQRDQIMLIMNRIFVDVLLDPLFVSMALVSRRNAVMAAKLAAALFFFCDETLIFSVCDGCTKRVYTLPQPLLEQTGAKHLYTLQQLLARRPYEQGPRKGKARKGQAQPKKTKEELWWEQIDSDTQRFMQSQTDFDLLVDNFLEHVVNKILEWLEDHGVVIDCPAEQLAQMVMSMLFRYLSVINSYMSDLHFDFVTAMTLLMQRTLHPAWQGTLQDQGFFIEPQLNLIYFIQLNLQSIPNFVFLWSKGRLDSKMAATVNYLLLYMLDIQLNIVMFLVLYTAQVREQREINLSVLLYTLYFVASMSSSSSPAAVQTVFQLLSETPNED